MNRTTKLSAGLFSVLMGLLCLQHLGYAQQYPPNIPVSQRPHSESETAIAFSPVNPGYVLAGWNAKITGVGDKSGYAFSYDGGRVGQTVSWSIRLTQWALIRPSLLIGMGMRSFATSEGSTTVRIGFAFGDVLFRMGVGLKRPSVERRQHGQRTTSPTSLLIIPASHHRGKYMWHGRNTIGL